MIKLTRNTAPDKLSEEFVKEGTEKYKTTKESVWNVDWLKEALLNMSNQKCAYCEGRLDLKSDYMEVEHFRDKKDYPNDVLIWENLLPSCKHCNGHKNSHDVISEPIINPFVDFPKEHIFLKSYLYKPKDELGQSTIDVLDLNDSTRLVIARCTLGTEINKRLEERLHEIKTGLTQTGAKKRFKNKMRELMKKCLPDAEYSAVCSTELISSTEYAEIVNLMKDLSIWDEEFEDYNSIISSIALVA
ncbi:MAG: HNH endonuclease [Parabacteroides sp.]|nr:HNH endonuclease [Parabacteroides sp.]MDY4757486.1 HNH endonuclease [Parabacteroides sp.]